ncbi:uncharacterized protein BBA_10158 [Beauveria bassiana ARSEF 2860]|uniref:Uncharacterized protein n=1 Tax=Beauveria bassiana (strain ARSEF 2860) TaxID=655819 RepID=J4UEX7_BEAB2|nr:uncharacterized protein BBA_10158 [Beauveria bassiana ARSEF 2860]EJP60892.1 hypothetical protein BBA_10158 [Beauveria bassiana ARSEF 2860]
MVIHDSIPLFLGRERTLQISQKQKDSRGSGSIVVRHVPPAAPTVLDIYMGGNMSYVSYFYSAEGKSQIILIYTFSAEPGQIYLRWPKGSREVGLRRLHLQSDDYNISLAFDAPSVPATATHLSLADIDFVHQRKH